MEPRFNKELLESYDLYTNHGHYIGPVTMTIQEVRIRVPWYERLKWWFLRQVYKIKKWIKRM